MATAKRGRWLWGAGLAAFRPLLFVTSMQPAGNSRIGKLRKIAGVLGGLPPRLLEIKPSAVAVVGAARHVWTMGMGGGGLLAAPAAGQPGGVIISTSK